MPVDQSQLEALKIYKSPRGWIFCPVHWSHDSSKSAEWAEAERKKYPREADYLREQEIDFGVHLGAKVYPGYVRSKHWYDTLEYEERVPLVLFCDFNASPMAWGVGQVVGGWIHVLEDLVRDPGTIEGGVEEFRAAYPHHRGGVKVYGDASVKGFYDTMRFAFRGYPSPVTYHIPEKNPLVRDRCNAVQVKLTAGDGFPGVRIQGPKCPQLIQDFEEVVWRPNGRDIMKTTDPNDPYTKRTHISDAFGYWVARDWMVFKEVGERMNPERAKPRPPRQYTKLLGDISYRKP